MMRQNLDRLPFQDAGRFQSMTMLVEQAKRLNLSICCSGTGDGTRKEWTE